MTALDRASPTPLEANSDLARRRRILLVESERDQGFYWDTIFRALGFEVLWAGTLVEAERLLESGPSIVVCGSLVVDGTGIGLFARLRARPELALVYLVLLTGSGEEVIPSLRAGANDCIDIAATYGEVRARLELAERVISLNEALHQKGAALSDALTVIRTELQSAAALQAAMLPKPLDHGHFHIRSLYRPSDALGGDMIGLTAVHSDRIAFGLVDVVGHGTASALISCSVMREMIDRMSTLIQAEDRQTWRDCGRIVIEELNRRYCALGLPGMYFTALAGVLETSSGRVDYCQAGHPNLIDFDPEYGWREVPDSGYPVGLIENAEYTGRDLQLEPGQRLLAVSDGFFRPTNDDPGGSVTLLRTLAESPLQIEAVMDRLSELAAGIQGVDRDDQSALLISRDAVTRG